MNRSYRAASNLLALAFAAWVGLPLSGSLESAEPRTIVLREHLSHTWREELVSYLLEYEPGECWERTLRLVSEGGNAVPAQLTDVQTHKDGSIAKATLWFVVPELPGNGTRTWRAIPGTKKGRRAKVKADLEVDRRGEVWEITTSKVGVRLLAGSEAPPGLDRETRKRSSTGWVMNKSGFLVTWPMPPGPPTWSGSATPRLRPGGQRWPARCWTCTRGR